MVGIRRAVLSGIPSLPVSFLQEEVAQQAFCPHHMKDIDGLSIDPIEDPARWNDDLAVGRIQQLFDLLHGEGMVFKSVNDVKDLPHEARCRVWIVKGNVVGNIVKIVAPETGQTLRRGETGEIAVKGPTLMIGYVGVPPEEALDEEGFYRAGDGGFIDDQGRLTFQGRINDIIGG